jgi:hypothetical protein
MERFVSATADAVVSLFGQVAASGLPRRHGRPTTRQFECRQPGASIVSRTGTRLTPHSPAG